MHAADLYNCDVHVTFDIRNKTEEKKNVKSKSKNAQHKTSKFPHYIPNCDQVMDLYINEAKHAMHGIIQYKNKSSTNTQN